MAAWWFLKGRHYKVRLIVEVGWAFFLSDAQLVGLSVVQVERSYADRLPPTLETHARGMKSMGAKHVDASTRRLHEALKSLLKFYRGLWDTLRARSCLSMTQPLPCAWSAVLRSWGNVSVVPAARASISSLRGTGFPRHECPTCVGGRGQEAADIML